MQSVRLIDRAADVGGTWYWNRYPGIACDVESYVYIPLLEELGYMPRGEVRQGRRDLCALPAHRRALRPVPRRVPADRCTRDPLGRGDSRWIIRTNRGDEMRARFVSMANGYQAKPKLPGIPGISAFRGQYLSHQPVGLRLHRRDSCRTWPDKRVGIIGTGATAVQCVPHLAQAAQQLYVFQRTPSSVDVRANQPTDLQWANALQPRLAARADPELSDPHRRRAGGRRSGRRRLDEHHPQAAGHAP